MEREVLTIEEYKKSVKNIVTTLKAEKKGVKQSIIYPAIYYKLKDMLVEKR